MQSLQKFLKRCEDEKKNPWTRIIRLTDGKSCTIRKMIHKSDKMRKKWTTEDTDTQLDCDRAATDIIEVSTDTMEVQQTQAEKHVHNENHNKQTRRATTS